MKVLLIVGLLFSFVYGNSYATVIHRYYDKKTGEERGVAYSGRDNTPCVTNLDWNVEVISEKDKRKYINLQKAQLKAKDDARKAKKDKIKARIRNKLKKLGLDEEEIAEFLGNR